jgi:hypothetical protein
MSGRACRGSFQRDVPTFARSPRMYSDIGILGSSFRQGYPAGAAPL